MELSFTKMHGLGNDFVVINAVSQPVELSRAQVARLADRHFGIGCDQLLLVEASQRPGIDFRYRIFNADGGEVAQCGNGARCFARFVRDKGLTQKQTLTVETASGDIILMVEADGRVRVNMGAPRFEPAALPLEVAVPQDRYQVELADGAVLFGAVSMGNPHAVIVVDSVDTAPVLSLGPLLQAHPLFPQRVNVGFMQLLGRDHIRLRVFERGSGETLACGTGACAAVVMGIHWGVLDDKVLVTLPGGPLEIEWCGHGEPVWMTGPAETVFEGKITL